MVNGMNRRGLFGALLGLLAFPFSLFKKNREEKMTGDLRMMGRLYIADFDPLKWLRFERTGDTLCHFVAVEVAKILPFPKYHSEIRRLGDQPGIIFVKSLKRNPPENEMLVNYWLNLKTVATLEIDELMPLTEQEICDLVKVRVEERMET